jgi:hypothetical protein
MTDEQIEQNADAYADVFGRHMVDYYGVKDAFISGAHSRDEEVNQLEKKVSALETVIVTARATISMQEAIIKDLRNPWISVNELPEEDPDNKGYSVNVIGLFPDGRISDCFCSLDEDIWFIEGIIIDRPTHWMPMPKV